MHEIKTGQALLITDPQTTSLNIYNYEVNKKKNKKKLHATHVMWHMTYDMWQHVTWDIRQMEGGEHCIKCKLILFGREVVLKIVEQKDVCSMLQSITT